MSSSNAPTNQSHDLLVSRFLAWEPVPHASAPARVQACIEMLDRGVRQRVVPAYWRERLNPATLDITDPLHCVAGQIWGYFPDGLTALEAIDGTVHPLAVGLDGWSEDDDARLTSAWQNRIEAMQTAAEAGHVRPAKAVA